MNMTVFLLEHLVHVCVFIYVRISVRVCVCIQATFSNSVYAFVSIYVSFKSTDVRVSYMCLTFLVPGCRRHVSRMVQPSYYQALDQEQQKLARSKVERQRPTWEL